MSKLGPSHKGGGPFKFCTCFVFLFLVLRFQHPKICTYFVFLFLVLRFQHPKICTCFVFLFLVLRFQPSKICACFIFLFLVLRFQHLQWSCCIGSIGCMGGADRTFAYKSKECLWQDWYILISGFMRDKNIANTGSDLRQLQHIGHLLLEVRDMLRS